MAQTRPPPRQIRLLGLALPEPLIGGLLMLEAMAPPALAVVVFLGGLGLLVSGTQPAEFWRISLLRDALPLPFSEASHLSASLTGLALMVLARGLWLRVDKARLAATAVLLAGAVFALAKGLDYESALLLAAVAAALTLTRRSFRRRGDWRSFRPGPGFLAIVALTVGAVTVIGLLAFRNTEFRADLWWSFAWRGDAPRFLRASLALAIAIAALTLDMLVNKPLKTRQPVQPVPPEVPAILARWPEAAAQVALSGDKQFLLAPEADAFLMYAVAGRSWIALGGPVGRPAAAEALVWRFVEKADRAGGRAAFYNVGPEAVPQLLDLGQSIVKIGEAAVVDLAGFSLDGPERKALRYARSRASRDGLGFAILPAGQVGAELAALKEVSDAWLATRQGREKGFSIGAFDAAYLSRFDIATYRHEGRIVAFANLLRGGGKAEMALDLMRFLPGQSPVLMEAFLTDCLIAARAEGYARFNLGGAPLSGLSAHRLAPVWTRIGTAIYRYGDEFYSFEGLRAFKEKFGPGWSPRYLTCPGGLSVARVLIDVALLISRPRPPGPAFVLAQPQGIGQNP